MASTTTYTSRILEDIGFADRQHVTQVQYPMCNLLNDPEELVIFNPVNVQQRYEPRELIPDDAVIANRSFDSEAETSHFVVNSVRGITHRQLHAERPGNSLLSQERSGIQRFLWEMMKYQQTTGRTEVHVVVFRPWAGAPDPLMRVRIERRSWYSMSDNIERLDTRVYDMVFDQFYNIRLVPPPYLQLIYDLFQGTTDRAVLHSRHWLGHHDRTFLPQQWKAPREADYGPHLAAAIETVPLADVDAAEMCGMCHELFHDKDPQISDSHEPVRLRCSHMFGRKCVDFWSHGGRDLNTEIVVGNLKCPYRCKDSPLSRDDLRELNHGLIEDIYPYDNRYTEYENFERSCADLDELVRADFPDGSKIIIDALALKQALEELYGGARTEPDSSSPDFVQPVHFQEAQVARTAIDQCLDEQDGFYMEAATLYNLLHIRVMEALGNSASFHGLQQVDPNASLIRRLQDYRPGFYPWLLRTISRMLRFPRLRRCFCQPGFHRHGLRLKYNRLDMDQTAVEDEPMD